MLKGGWSFDKPAWLVQEEKVKAEIDKYYNDAMKYYNNPDNNWFIPYRKGVKELWEFIDLVANEYGLNEYDVKLLKADAVFCSDNTIQEMSAQHYIRNHPREGLEGLALVMLTPRLSSNNSALKTRTKIEDDFKGFNFGNKEVYNSAKTPRTGAEWNEYFKSVYGNKNVFWKTEINSFPDIQMNPRALWGRSADEVGKMLGEGWTRGTYGSAGTGWKFTKGNSSVFYHPGGGVHEGSYYGFSSGPTGKVKVVGSDYKPLIGDNATIINK